MADTLEENNSKSDIKSKLNSSVRRRTVSSKLAHNTSSESAYAHNDTKNPADSHFFTSRRAPDKADRPIHVAQDSLFSASSGYTNYRGYLNLALLLLVLACSRVALENLIKYGVLINPVQWFEIFLHQPFQVPNLAMMLFLNFYILAALFIEQQLERKLVSNRFAFVFYTIMLTLELFLPIISVFLLEPHPIPTTLALSAHVIVFLKLISYAHVNYWCRKACDQDFVQKKKLSKLNSNGKENQSMLGQREKISYPQNLTLSNIIYFMLAPTLCYELNYPRSPSIRKRFVLKRIVECISLLLFMTALIQQWVIPTVRNSLRPLNEMQTPQLVERLLKLSIPNHFIWQLFFYWVFHSCLNLSAELLQFADRCFYKDWWNSETLNYFWANWNIPVHRWALRHLFKPMMRAGISPFNSAIIVFFVSAFFHEYLVSVPLRMFRLWAFLGMIAQVPLSVLTSKVIKGGKAGNLVVWLSLILGQPLAILMYYHDWYIYQHPTEIISSNITNGNVMPNNWMPDMLK